MEENDKKETIEEEIQHELELAVNGDTIAFFAVVVSDRSIFNDTKEVIAGVRTEDITPTIIMIDDGLSIENRLHYARAIVELGQRIREAALESLKKNE